MSLLDAEMDEPKIGIWGKALNMYKIRFHDGTDCTVHTFTSWCHPKQKFQNIAKSVCFGPLFFNLIRLIQ